MIHIFANLNLYCVKSHKVFSCQTDVPLTKLSSVAQSIQQDVVVAILGPNQKADFAQHSGEKYNKQALLDGNTVLAGEGRLRDVYLGQYKGRTVAIKVLKEAVIKHGKLKLRQQQQWEQRRDLQQWMEAVAMDTVSPTYILFITYASDFTFSRCPEHSALNVPRGGGWSEQRRSTNKSRRRWLSATACISCRQERWPLD